MSSTEARCIDLVHDRLPGPLGVALAATSPSSGPFSWSAGASPAGTPFTASTRMYAASITKQFLAALVGETIPAGSLTLDVSVGRILPALPAWAERLRVRHLIHHTRGLPSTARLLSVLHLHDEAALDTSRRAPATAPHRSTNLCRPGRRLLR